MLPDNNFFKKYAQEKNITWQKKNILVEYLQTQILKALSLSKFNSSLSFLGGTCLRFIYGINRFSEDLDFDLVLKKGFKISELEKEIKNKLELQGFKIDSKIKRTENIHIIFFKFKNVLQEFGISAPKNEKVLIKFEIDYTPCKSLETETKFVNSFNETFPLLVNNIQTLFAQKTLAIILRPYQKGRDFYDLVWFLSQKNIEPNYRIFKEKKVPIKNKAELIKFLEKQFKISDLKKAVKDVQRFLFYPEQAQWILKLPEYLKSFQ